MFHHICKHREDSWKYIQHVTEYFYEPWGVWKCGQTLSWVFDISSQSKLKLRRKQRIRIIAKNLCMQIGHLHDGVIVLQLPLFFLFPMLIRAFAIWMPLGLQNLILIKKNELSSGRYSEMTVLCKSAIKIRFSNLKNSE